jgi:hypothetical protein
LRRDNPLRMPEDPTTSVIEEKLRRPDRHSFLRADHDPRWKGAPDRVFPSSRRCSSSSRTGRVADVRQPRPRALDLRGLGTRDFFKRADWAHPEIERVWVGGPEPGSRKGLADVAAEQREFLRAWQDFRVVPDDYRELDGQRVLVLVRYSWRGTTSGLTQEMKRAHLFHVREADRRHAATATFRKRSTRRRKATRSKSQPEPLTSAAENCLSIRT